MFRMNDFILLVVIFSSMLAGILLPRIGSVFRPYPIYLMMILLFFSFLSIKIETIWYTIRNHTQTVIWLALLKLIALPLTVYFLFKVLYPSYAIAALLLMGISTGVVAPFVSTLVNANVNLVFVMVVISSLIVPFTLPVLVKMLLGRSIEISLTGMMHILCMVIFVPILAVETLRRLTPGTLATIMRIRYPVSLIIFAIINLGVFSRYSDFFFQNPSIILESTLVAIALGGICLVVGIFTLLKGPVENQLASTIILGNMNNVLVLVFSAEFFGPLEPTVAAMYMIPFFGLILPLRVYCRLRRADA